MRHFSSDWEQLPLVATAVDLDAPTLQPAKEGFKGRAGHRANPIPDDHTGYKFPPHPFGRPLCLTSPIEEAAIGLGLDTPDPHLFGQAMGRDINEGISLAKELDRSRGLAAAPAAVKVAQVVPRLRVIVAWRGAWSELFFVFPM